MLFGGEVTTASQLKRSMSLDKLDDSTRAGRERIRETVRETFSVKDGGYAHVGALGGPALAKPC